MIVLGMLVLLVFFFSLVSHRVAQTIITAPVVFTVAGTLLFIALPGLSEVEVKEKAALLLSEIALKLVLFTIAYMKSSKSSHRLPIPFWITLARATLATFLGLTLVIQPDKTRPMLVNFMGMFWLASGIMSLRWGASGERPRPLSLVAGVVGVLAGLLTLTRNLTRGVLDEILVVSLLGGVILLTGLIHVVGGFRTGEGTQREWSWTSFLLGVFEVVLGALLLISPLNIVPLVYWSASIWAFIGAFMLLSDALRQRAQARLDQEI